MVKLKIALIGYGKMGKEIEQIAIDRGHTIVSTIDPNNKEAQFKKIDDKSLKGVDVCIDFTHPDCAVQNVEIIADHGVNLVLGTTGWYDQMDRVRSIVQDKNIGFMWASNFSIGVNMFFRVVDAASQLVDKVPEYDVGGYEFHHNQKADSPSGTAKSIAELIVKNIKRKKTINYDRVDRSIKPNELQFSSVRVGNVPGTHSVLFDSAADTIELKHTARNRGGFALGAVMAAEFVHKKKGFFEIDQLMEDLIGGD
ncbi:MAG: 4-hydroxy-tetrahydrodipicolinate reductase [Candidatus Woesearchaeota archaeon]|jgi:4-hydroxy-tetrahydrodipicolinate reductase|nr:4-hydroxy-tetrahydrodipicolinate reductase [Candidatus Woesearchaeota archaeon]MDP7324073.1 4-hydroxy-tetrahydrodipicolinate reductase [Candidatus Woesearchaeota archaeon]MDP7457589.1 4-hydroxy-tetrahydrodipicolinate reductase [Candidatus Woesearchaeota archaeon]